VADGFRLSTFVSGFSPDSGGVGPLGIAFPGNGTVLAGDSAGNIRVFPSDTDGQSASAGHIATNLGSNSVSSGAAGLTQINGSVYLANQLAGTLLRLNAAGTVHSTAASGFDRPTGLIANPVTGHLLVTTRGSPFELADVNPANGASSVVHTFTSTGDGPDGVAVTADGDRAYVAVGNNHILGLRLSDGAVVFDSGALPVSAERPDGIAIGIGSLGGDIFVNTNGGDIFEINLSTLSQTLIAAGGSRGDFVAVDPTNGSLLLTQSDDILRLTPPVGGGFVGGPIVVPEPSSLALLALGGGALAGWRRWRKRKATA
jgi:DNA-binding beta-propeller fold protein YncE